MVTMGRTRYWTKLGMDEIEFVERMGGKAGLNHQSEKIRFCINLLKTIVDGEMIYLPREAAEVIRVVKRK